MKKASPFLYPSHKPAHVSIWLKILLCLPIALGTKSTFLLVSYNVASWELQLLLFTSPPSTSPRLHSYSLDLPPSSPAPQLSLGNSSSRSHLGGISSQAPGLDSELRRTHAHVFPSLSSVMPLW